MFLKYVMLFVFVREQQQIAQVLNKQTQDWWFLHMAGARLKKPSCVKSTYGILRLGA